MVPPSVVVFDVNETLLSLDPITERLESVFGVDPPTGEWFARLLHGSLLANALDSYRPFGDIAVEALLGVAAKRDLVITGDDARSLLALMSSLPPHPDVLPGIDRLTRSGTRIAALTNGSREVAEAQIRNAGLDTFMERVISVDEVRRFKPDPAAYLHAAKAMHLPIDEMMLVAAHDWDCAGAIAAGAEAAFVQRPGVVWSLPSGKPDLVVDDIHGLATALGA